jgi:hypothetical protein
METANKAFNAAKLRAQIYDDYCKEVVVNCSTEPDGTYRIYGILFNCTFKSTAAASSNLTIEELRHIGACLCDHFSQFVPLQMLDDDKPKAMTFYIYSEEVDFVKQLVKIRFGHPNIANGIVDIKNIDY